VVLRDISESTNLFRAYPGKNLRDSIDDYLRDASTEKLKPSPDDRIGVISFANRPMVDSMPNTTLDLTSRAIRESGNGTDIGGAIQLALAALGRDSMKRLVLIS